MMPKLIFFTDNNPVFQPGTGHFTQVRSFFSSDDLSLTFRSRLYGKVALV